MKLQWFYNDYKYEAVPMLFPEEYFKWLKIEDKDYKKFSVKLSLFRGPTV